MTYESLKQEILKHIEVPEEEFDADENLMNYGLDSITVFDFIAAWGEQGIEVEIAALAENPTLNGWWTVLRPLAEARA